MITQSTMTCERLAVLLQRGLAGTREVLMHQPHLYGFACGYLDGMDDRPEDKSLDVAGDDYAWGYRMARKDRKAK